MDEFRTIMETQNNEVAIQDMLTTTVEKTDSTIDIILSVVGYIGIGLAIISLSILIIYIATKKLSKVKEAVCTQLLITGTIMVGISIFLKLLIEITPFLSQLSTIEMIAVVIGGVGFMVCLSLLFPKKKGEK